MDPIRFFMDSRYFRIKNPTGSFELKWIQSDFLLFELRTILDPFELKSTKVDPSDSEADSSDRGISPFVSDSDVDSASTVLKEGFFVRTIVTLKGERKSTGSNLSDGDKELDRTPFGVALYLDFFYVPKEEDEGRRKEEEAKHF
ncbi:hypothetical protein TorRG33x02_007960 [Trema orientale]|uniref:Uncharacterized protein n=1 Tax=Trema orientale TaxID=63057 RepID=A0A2P5G0P4_TREOI|nr:hypothetical protein TorRG33x02_007960 [Trema orientale]